VKKRQNLAFLTESLNTNRAKLFCTSCKSSTFGINTNAENAGDHKESNGKSKIINLPCYKENGIQNRQHQKERIVCLLISHTYTEQDSEPFTSHTSPESSKGLHHEKSFL
jgi:hypothetical protein